MYAYTRFETRVVFYKRQLWTFNETIRDIGLNESYCYMWHEGLARRRLNQIASILYKFVLEKVPNSVTYLVTYSDTCWPKSQYKRGHYVYVSNSKSSIFRDN